ncbi:amidohydrolase family protein [Bradyrhizobium sp. CER78]|uniref:amidohydrolase family protein n=1 Tax=Bradyrhizobium sp. CER78 TaxID=3039162 RepID=UPI002446D1E3|nr:amidohydrolase family protein [Bradyrhizobium sp. CER78]MDH2384291.1 amidohydrolase family protein [Bradyrhizobium sp. CER78]
MSSRIRKIALEEHFMVPGFEEYSKVFTKHMDSAAQSRLSSQLKDFDDLRLDEMDRAGIDKVVLSQTGPSVQAEPNVDIAIRRAAEGNDYLARQVKRRPARYAGFASLAMHSPKAAADELTRAVEDLGFKGALVNGHTGGIYYDHPSYDAFWERMQHLDVPLYLHPTDPSLIPKAYDGHPELTGAVWGWGVETATHALRLLFGGVFDRFPRLKIILGHMGEGLPMLLWRFDSRFAVYPHGVQLARKPSEYFGRNIFITTSGVCSPAALTCALAEMGNDAVMFSVDYPYESTAIAADFIESTSIPEEVRAQVCSRNAERILKLA